MRYVDKERLKDFNFESPEPSPVVIVKMGADDKSPAERYYEETAALRPHNWKHQAFAMQCALAQDDGRFMEKLRRNTQISAARQERKRLAAHQQLAFPRSKK